MRRDDLKWHKVSSFGRGSLPVSDSAINVGVYATSPDAAIVQAVVDLAPQWEAAGAEIHVVDKDGQLRRFVGLELAR